MAHQNQHTRKFNAKELHVKKIASEDLERACELIHCEFTMMEEKEEEKLAQMKLVLLV